MDNTAPDLQTIACVGSVETDAASVDFASTFAEAVTGVDPGDFSVDTSGAKTLPSAVITGITGSGAAYTMTVNTGSGNGPLGIVLSDDDSILDMAGNPLRVLEPATAISPQARSTR